MQEENNLELTRELIDELNERMDYSEEDLTDIEKSSCR